MQKEKDTEVYKYISV